MEQYGTLLVYITITVLRYIPGSSAHVRYTSRRAIARYHDESRASAQELVNEYTNKLDPDELRNYTFVFQPHPEGMTP